MALPSVESSFSDRVETRNLNSNGSVNDSTSGSSSTVNGKLDNNTSTNTNTASTNNNKSVKRSTTKRMKLKRDAFFKKDEPEKKTEQVATKTGIGVENGGGGGGEGGKDEVEEGELGTLKSPRREVENGEPPEKGEIVVGVGGGSSSDKWRKGGEMDSMARWRRTEGVRGEFSLGGVRLRSDLVMRKDRSPEKGRVEFGLSSSWKGSKDEVEKGEFIPDRWHKGEFFRDEYGYSKGRRQERERRYEREWTPPSFKYSGEDVSPGRDVSRSGNRHSKRVARWEANQERNYPKLSSKVIDEAASHKNEYVHGVGRSQGREPGSSTRLKRHGTDSDSGDRKHFDDYGDYASSKSRRLSGDSFRAAHNEQYSRQPGEKAFRNSNSSRTATGAVAASDRPTARHYDSSANRGGYDRYRRSPSYSERHRRSPSYSGRHRRSPSYSERHRRSPSYSERSPPRERARYHDHRDRTPVRNERSPCYRGHRHDNKDRSPSCAERSPQERGRPNDYRDSSPSYEERSPHDRSRPGNHHQTSRRIEVSETKQSDRVQELKPTDKSPTGKDSVVTVTDPISEPIVENGLIEETISHESHSETHRQTPGLEFKEQPSSVINGVMEELPSMEEDMDICDTPPHVPAVSNVNPGKWYYIDHLGEECGPSRLCDLKALVEEGILMSDHLVKHSDSDRWVTVENAASPLVTANFTTIFSDCVTQLVSPPEAPGNLLVDVGDAEQPGDQIDMESSDTFAQGGTGLGDHLSIEDLSINDRVGALLDGVTVVPGKELEIVGEVLQMTFDQSEWERFDSLEGMTV